MQVQAWIPVAAVVIGWLLSELGHHFRASAEAKRDLRKAISQLIYLRDQIAVLASTLRTIQQIPVSSSSSDSTRRSVIERRVRAVGRYEERLRNAIDTVAEFDPIEAKRLQNVSQMLHESPQLQLEALVDEEDLYESITTFEAQSLDTNAAIIAHVIKKMSPHMGPVMWWKTRKYLDSPIRSAGELERERAE